ncbi:MAG: hypothetical protein AAFX06_06725 [Planctomycetota bacterium]
MTETEVVKLRDSQLAAFTDRRCIGAVSNWQQVVERAPNGWLLYRVGRDKGIAFTEGEDWSDEPWTVVHRLSTDAPLNYAYCPTLESAVDEMISGG